MRRRLRSNNSTILKLAMVGIVAMAGGFLLTSLMASKGETQALSATEFQPGRIIDDSIFYNPNTMTAAEIDAFIDSHNPACDMWGTQKVYGNVTRAEYVKQLRASGNTKYHDPPFVCISEYYENPETHKTNFSTGGKKEEGMLSAGEIIYKAAQEYSINPQVLLVMLKKESYVWGDDWPHNFQYNTVMGYACPDGAPCDTKYYGFYNQVMMAAWQLNYYRDHIYSYNYRPYTTNNILYNPDRSCGSKSVYLENIATTSLYIYTPYVPNDAALANYPGTSWCGSYGNRNFYMYFREWFGSTLGTPKEEISFPDGEYYIVSAADTTKALRLFSDNNILGTKIILGDRKDGIYSTFRFEHLSDNSYKIINQGSGLAVDITGANVKQGVNIEQWNSNEGIAQQFTILNNRDGSFSIAASRNKGLSLASSANGEIILDWNDTNKTQQFYLVPVIAPVTDGDYYVTSGISGATSLTLSGGAVKGSNVTVETSNYSANQSFAFFFDAKTGSYTISPSTNHNLSLDVNGASKEKNSNIQIWSSNSSCAQRWTLLKNQDQTIRFLNACSGLSMDVHGGWDYNGANIATWTNHDNPSEKWMLSSAVTSERVIEDGLYRLSSGPLSLSLQPSNTLTLTATNEDDKLQLFYIQYDITKRLYSISPYNKQFFLTEDSSISTESGSAGSFIISKNENNTYSITSTNTESHLLDISSWSLSTSTLPQDNLSGTYTIKSATNPDFALDINGASNAIGANIQTWSRNSSVAQVFSLTHIDSNDTYEIRDTFTNRVLDMNGGYSAIGANVSMWRYNGGCNQRWKISAVDTGVYRIQESCGLLSLDALGGWVYSGTNVAVWRNKDVSNQYWILEEKK